MSKECLNCNIKIKKSEESNLLKNVKHFNAELPQYDFTNRHNAIVRGCACLQGLVEKKKERSEDCSYKCRNTKEQKFKCTLD